MNHWYDFNTMVYFVNKNSKIVRQTYCLNNSLELQQKIRYILKVMKLKNINYKPKKRVTLTDEIANFISSQIENGEIKEGDILPPEITLAEQFQVSRPVIREALAQLKFDGLIDSRKGSGAIVSSLLNKKTFKLKVSEDHELDENHLFEFRLLLEGEAAALAAIRCTQEDIDNLEQCLEKMEKAVKTKESGYEPDINFHSTLANASGNPYIRDFVNYLHGKITLMVSNARNKSNLESESAHIVQMEHVRIFEAIKNKNAQKAKEAARIHILRSAYRQGYKLLNEDW